MRRSAEQCARPKGHSAALRRYRAEAGYSFSPPGHRIDSPRNIVRDPRVALLFLIPGSGTTFRVNGMARISADPELLASLAVEGKAPRTAILIGVVTAYFPCARAIVRSALWDPSRHVDSGAIPSPGSILAAISAGEVGGKAYDELWPSRAAAMLW